MAALVEAEAEPEPGTVRRQEAPEEEEAAAEAY